MEGILEIFDTKGIIDYLKDRVYPTYMGTELFPEEKRDELKFDELSEGSNIPVIASVHAFDAEAEIGTREAQEKSMELALIKRKMQLKEEEIIKILHPRTNQEKKWLINNVYADIDNLVQGIMARVELMRMEIVAKGTVTLEENDLKDSAKKVTQNAKKFFDKCKKINNDKKDNTDTDTVNQDNNFNNADNINETGNNKTVKNTNINENTDNENITNR